MINTRGVKTGLTHWVCSFFLQFNVGRAKGLGQHPIMCLSHFLWDFVGTNINIFFELLGLKGAVSMGPPRPALTFFRDEPRFKSPTLNYAHPASPHFL